MNRIVALDLRSALEDLGYAVVGAAASSDEALRAADERRPDLVLMDIRICGASDGIQTAGMFGLFRWQCGSTPTI